jgi:hypothetical protein
LETSTHNDTLDESVLTRMRDITSKGLLTPTSSANVIYLQDVEEQPKSNRSRSNPKSGTRVNHYDEILNSLDQSVQQVKDTVETVKTKRSYSLQNQKPLDKEKPLKRTSLYILADFNQLRETILPKNLGYLEYFEQKE